MARQRITVDVVSTKRNTDIAAVSKNPAMTDDDYYYESQDYEERCETLKSGADRYYPGKEGDNSGESTDESTHPPSSSSSSSSSSSDLSNDEQNERNKWDGSLTLEEVFTIGGNSLHASKQEKNDRQRINENTTDNNSTPRSKVRFRPGKGFLHIRPIDCNYTAREIVAMWFTQDEYNFFLKDCDDEAQKCEARVKAKRMARIKRKIRMQNSQRKKELEDGKDSENDQSDNFFDSDEDESSDDFFNSDEEGEHAMPCPLGLEAWTLEGYKTRQRRRKTAIDAVLDEQFASWDRGEQEHPEVMATLYFAASVTSKRFAGSKALKLQAQVRKYLLESTLKDYSKAVRALSLLQQSLHSIKGSAHGSDNSTINSSNSNNNGRPPMVPNAVPPALRTPPRKEGYKSHNKSPVSVIIDRAISITEGNDEACHNQIAEDKLILKSPKPSKSRLQSPNSPGTRVLSPKSASSPISSARTVSSVSSSGSSCRQKSSQSTLSSKELKLDASKSPSSPAKSYKSKTGIKMLDTPPSPPLSERNIVKSSSGRRKPESLRSLDLSVQSEKKKKDKRDVKAGSSNTIGSNVSRTSSKSPRRQRQMLGETLKSPRQSRRTSATGSTTSASSNACKSPRHQRIASGNEVTRGKSPRPTRRVSATGSVASMTSNTSNSMMSPRPSKSKLDPPTRGKSPRTPRRHSATGSTSTPNTPIGNVAGTPSKKIPKKSPNTIMKVAKNMIEKTSAHSNKKDSSSDKKTKQKEKSSLLSKIRTGSTH